MSRRIMILSPWGVDYMDEPALEVARRHARPDTELEIRNLGEDAAPLPWPVAASEGLMVEAARKAETDGFDGIAIGCCADPFLASVREAVNIPVSAPSEAAAYTSRQFGKVAILARRLSDSFLPLIPSQGNWDFWNGTAQKYGLAENDYTLRAVQVPTHPSPEDIDRLTPSDPGLLRDLTIEAMTDALYTNGVTEARAAVADGAEAIYFACAYWSRGIDALDGDHSAFGAPLLAPIPTTVGFVEQALVAQGK